jgi:hypothetical protein
MSFSTTYTRTKTFANGGTLLPADLNSIQDDLGNQLALANVAAGVNEGANVRRGKSIIATAESRTNTSYGTLATPDRVQNVVLPTDGLLMIYFQARWQNSVSAAGSAALFIGANQLKIGYNASVPAVAESDGVLDAAEYMPLNSTFTGLETITGVSGVTYSGDVTTGQVVGNPFYGGPCTVFAAAGTYTVSVQYKSTSGSVTVADRKLWVWSVGF